MPYKKILFAADLSEADRSVGERVAELAQLHGAEVVLLHVVEPLQIAAGGELLSPPDLELEQLQLQQAREALPKLADEIGLGGSECRVELGATRSEIVALAEAVAADLIVLGSHGRHGLALLLGSTANAVLHHAPCDLLAVRLKG